MQLHGDRFFHVAKIFPTFYAALKFHHRFHKNPPLNISSHLNPAYNLTPCFLKIYFNVIFPSRSRSRSPRVPILVRILIKFHVLLLVSSLHGELRVDVRAIICLSFALLVPKRLVYRHCGVLRSAWFESPSGYLLSVLRFSLYKGISV